MENLSPGNCGLPEPPAWIGWLNQPRLMMMPTGNDIFPFPSFLLSSSHILSCFVYHDHREQQWNYSAWDWLVSGNGIKISVLRYTGVDTGLWTTSTTGKQSSEIKRKWWEKSTQYINKQMNASWSCCIKLSSELFPAIEVILETREGSYHETVWHSFSCFKKWWTARWPSL